MSHINSVPEGPKRFLKRFLTITVSAVLVAGVTQWLLASMYGIGSLLARNITATTFFLVVWSAVLLVQPKMMARDGVTYAPEFFYSLHVPGALVVASAVVIVPMLMAYAWHLVSLPLLIIPAAILALGIVSIPVLMIVQKFHYAKLEREWQEFRASQRDEQSGHCTS